MPSSDETPPLSCEEAAVQGLNVPKVETELTAEPKQRPATSNPWSCRNKAILILTVALVAIFGVALPIVLSIEHVRYGTEVSVHAREDGGFSDKSGGEQPSPPSSGGTPGKMDGAPEEVGEGRMPALRNDDTVNFLTVSSGVDSGFPGETGNVSNTSISEGTGSSTGGDGGLQGKGKDSLESKLGRETGGSTVGASGESEGAESEKGPAPPPPSSGGATGESEGSVDAPPAQSGQLTAADIDDNLNFEAYLAYKKRMVDAEAKERSESILPNPKLSDRVTVSVTDSSGAPFSSALVEVEGQQELKLPAGTNGKLFLFPALDGLSDASWNVKARAPGGTCPEDCSKVSVESNNSGPVALQIPRLSSLPSQMDLALVVDTTGSMGNELDYLQSELKTVLSRVTADLSKNVDIRVGFVAYRDHGDNYVVATTPFSTPNDAIAALMKVRSGGGGDYPEAMDEAMGAAEALQWRNGNVARVLLLVADAPPHDENLQRTVSSALQLRQQGVKVYGLAASGVADTAEYLMRLMGVMTGSRYMWLTDDSGIGNPHAEPRVLCYQATRLDHLLIRVLISELLGERVEAESSEVIREVGAQEGGVCKPGAAPSAAPSAEPSLPPSPMAAPTAAASVQPSVSSTSGYASTGHFEQESAKPSLPPSPMAAHTAAASMQPSVSSASGYESTGHFEKEFMGNGAAAAVGAVAGIVCCALVLGMFLLVRRRRRKELPVVHAVTVDNAAGGPDPSDIVVEAFSVEDAGVATDLDNSSRNLEKLRRDICIKKQGNNNPAFAGGSTRSA